MEAQAEVAKPVKEADEKNSAGNHSGGIWRSLVEKFWHPTTSFVFVAWMEQTTHIAAEAVKHNLIPGLNAELWGIAGGILGLYVSREANDCLLNHHDPHSPHQGAFAHWRKFHDAAVTFAGHVSAGWLFSQAASVALVPFLGHSTLLMLTADGLGRWLYHVAEDWVREKYRKNLHETGGVQEKEG